MKSPDRLTGQPDPFYDGTEIRLRAVRYDCATECLFLNGFGKYFSFNFNIVIKTLKFTAINAGYLP